MSKMLSTAVLAATFALAATPAAAATTLTFSNACGGLCADGDNISQSYGDIAGILNISYRSVAGPGSQITVGNNRSWTTGYGDLSDVIWGAEGSVLEIAFEMLDANKQITFNSVDYAAWGGANVSTRIGLYSLTGPGLGNAIFTTATITAPGFGHSTLSQVVTSESGFRFHFGPDAYYAGIDNLTFTISDINVAGDVPEPTTWLSMILGFGLIGGAARRRAGRRSVAALI